MTPASAARRLPLVLAAVVLLALVVSGVRPYDRLTWLLETFWVIGGLPLLVVLWRRFPLTTLLCCLLAVHALVLIVGGHYTYARVPFGHWLQDVLALWSALAAGSAADAFLAVQGDQWDTQWDMACALIGAVASLLLLTRLHDRQLARLRRD
ncbi:DUF2238 domain-containing protein [Nonomuraea sp. NPDC004186]